jgi:hypothetical protein
MQHKFCVNLIGSSQGIYKTNQIIPTYLNVNSYVWTVKTHQTKLYLDYIFYFKIGIVLFSNLDRWNAIGNQSSLVYGGFVLL